LVDLFDLESFQRCEDVRPVEADAPGAEDVVRDQAALSHFIDFVSRWQAKAEPEVFGCQPVLGK